jgi:hypothetical protein
MLEHSSEIVDSHNKEPNQPFNLSMFSLNGNSINMELKMLDDKFVLDRIAILGQMTVIYAKPNSGKTLLVLWMLIQSIKDAKINGDNVSYVNADDNYRGLVEKLKLAEQYEFNMLCPGHAGFESKNFMQYMRQMIVDDSVRGKIIILDTLKKFTNLMDKTVATEFMRVAREFTSHGGTLILLAHVNKNKGVDGKVIAAGTSDVPDDADCVFILDEVDSQNNGRKQVLFENIKSRGDVAKEIAFSYDDKREGHTYSELLYSVQALSEKDVQNLKMSKSIILLLSKNKKQIEVIVETIELGITLKTPLVENAHKESGISKNKLIKVLDEHTGDFYVNGHRWKVTKGDKNAKSYELLKPVYLDHKNTSANNPASIKGG